MRIHGSKFVLSVFAAASLIMGGCAAAPRIHEGLSTTTPVTQNRDHAIYDWQTRHEGVLEYNRTHQAEVVVIGDSIIHYWGGEPVAPRAWAPDAWDRAFAGVTVENLGFGWDRTENVLWRLDDGELDGIAPRLIIVIIGTNNTGVNTARDIADGIEAVCVRTHQIQPQAKILLLGILPRRNEKPPRPVITERVNHLLQVRLGKLSWLTFRDLGDSFRNPDGSVKVSLFADGVHPSHAGYEVLADRIHGEITSLLN